MPNPNSTRDLRRREDPDQRNLTLIRRTGQFVVAVLGVGSSVLSFTAFGLSWVSIALVGLIIALGISLFANVVMVASSQARGPRAHQIAFLTPSSGGQPFYTAALTGLVRSASLAMGQDYIVVPSMPIRSFEAVSIWSLFASLEDRQGHIDGIIFIPDDPDSHFDELVGFHEKRGDVPLVLMDVYFDLSHCDERTKGRLPSFVGGDEVAGGRLAADIALANIKQPGRATPVVLVVNGGSAPWEMQRSASFRDRIREVWPSIQFVETPAIQYSRVGAYSHCLTLLASMADSEHQVDLDAIFACNDDMAIGARSAIVALMRDGYRFASPPQIVGYDGISEIREYIDARDIYIAGTVDVRVDEQANQAMMLMHKLIRMHQRRSELILVAPQAVTRI